MEKTAEKFGKLIVLIPLAALFIPCFLVVSSLQKTVSGFAGDVFGV